MLWVLDKAGVTGDIYKPWWLEAYQQDQLQMTEQAGPQRDVVESLWAWASAKNPYRFADVVDSRIHRGGILVG
jgi:hypothetical protein